MMSKYIISALLLLSLGTLTTAALGDSNFSPEIDSIAYGDSLVNQAPIPEPVEEIKSVEAIITAYSSRVGTQVRPGVVAANWLPLGTQIRIPEIFGDQIFTVEDRMHWRNSDKIDVWFSNTSEALRFGKQRARIEIL
jgi:3D (Asp-Asp-Asp) domain-containing protein